MNNNPENYKLGIFYFNKDDNRIFVPKMISSFGWTLNFARPATYLFIIGLIGLVVLLSRI